MGDARQGVVGMSRCERATSSPFSYPEPFLRAVRRGAVAKSISNWHLIGYNEGYCSNNVYILLPCFYGIRFWIWPEPLVPLAQKDLELHMHGGEWERKRSFTSSSCGPTSLLLFETPPQYIINTLNDSTDNWLTMRYCSFGDVFCTTMNAW
jgi:hypothetical protein